MTSKDDFSEDEWGRIVRAPFVAGLAVSLADPGGPAEMDQESAAVLEAATHPASEEELIVQVALDIQADVRRNTNPLQGYQASWPGTAPAGEQVLVELRAVQQIVTATATAQESEAFAGWLVDTATAAAVAAKEKGFFGVGGKQVSHGERHLLEKVRAAVSLP